MPEVRNPVDGVRTSYEVSGQGPAVVFLHGAGLSRAVWRGLGYLKGLPGYTHVRLDARGHGRSDTPHDPASYAPELMAGDVLAVLDAEGISSAAVLGYSLGARTGWTLVTEHPDRVAAFVAMAGSHRSQRGTIEQLFFPGYLSALRSGDIEQFVAGFGPDLDSATRVAFRRNDPRALAALFAATEENGESLPDSALRDVATPTLLVAGTADQPRCTDAVDELALLPDARLTILPDHTHSATLGAVAQVLAAVQPFLARAHPPSPP